MAESTRSRPPIRLTRRGRAVLFGLGLLVAAVLALLLVVAFAVPASRAAPADPVPAGPAPADPVPAGPVGQSPSAGVAVVLPGDTLWSVAARAAPSRDPYGMIEEIRRLNGLTGHTIHPGQELLLPAG